MRLIRTRELAKTLGQELVMRLFRIGTLVIAVKIATKMAKRVAGGLP